MSGTGRWRDDEYIPISALEHYSYCPRQCALIHVEQVWDENIFTLRGTRLHERADRPITRSERGGAVRVERALPLWSECYGLTGRADIVEFPAEPGSGQAPVPVEYKHGERPPALWRHDEIQVCAQALCLEEMQGADDSGRRLRIEEGAIYSGKTRKRRTFKITDTLREETIAIIANVRSLLFSSYNQNDERKIGQLPSPPDNLRICRKCSLADACLPESLALGRAASRFAARSLYMPEPWDALVASLPGDTDNDDTVTGKGRRQSQ